MLAFSTLHFRVPLEASHAIRLIGRLARPDVPRPLVFETRADDEGIHYLVGCEPDATTQIAKLIELQLPDARLERNARREPVLAAARLSLRPRTLPLDEEATDSVIFSTYAAFASRRKGELVSMQLTLGTGRGPSYLPRTIEDPTAPAWKAWILTPAPASNDLRARLRRRAERPTIGAVLRVGVSAATPGRREHLARDVVGALGGLESPGLRIGFTREPARVLNDQPTLRGVTNLSPNELLPLTGWPVSSDNLPGLPSAHPRHVSAPATLSRSDSVFARSTTPGDERDLGIKPADRNYHLAISGATGAGKSTVFIGLVLDDLRHHRAAAVLDPKRQLVDAIADRIDPKDAENVVVIDAADPNPAGFNPLDTTGRNADVVVDGIVSALKAIFDDGWGPRTEDLLHTGLLTLAGAGEHREEPYTLLDLPRLLTDATFRSSVVGSMARDPLLASTWAAFEELSPGARASIIAAPMNKLRKYALRKNVAAVLGQPRPKFRLRDIFRDGKTVLVPLNDSLLGPGAAQLLGSLVVSELWMATLERAAERNPTARPASIYIDEVGQFLHLPTSIEDAYATARSYGVSFNTAFQFRRQLPESMREALDVNARNQIIFATGAKDARDYARMAPDLEPDDFSQLGLHEVYARVVVDGTTTKWFSARTLPAAPAIGAKAEVFRLSRERYGAVPHFESQSIRDDEQAPPNHRKARRP
ncbi:type IV secretory system conjugative DNA transfer family protein [Mesorhizobium japonicum]|uniref:type IV secretory system conjugative DNA transfer family protein n=1 Tax=Mesorhizobium japonicum TaxID=2066070 RepID=UPI003B5B55CD